MSTTTFEFFLAEFSMDELEILKCSPNDIETYAWQHSIDPTQADRLIDEAILSLDFTEGPSEELF